LLLPTLGEEARRGAIDGFMELFEPGNIVGFGVGHPVAPAAKAGIGFPPAGRPAVTPPTAARTSSR
jgi:hypothetical protein